MTPGRPPGRPPAPAPWRVVPTPGTAAAVALAFLAWRGAALSGAPLGSFVALAVVAALVLDLVWAVWATRRVPLRVGVPTGEVVSGDPVPIRVVTNRTGRWQVRVRALGPDHPVHLGGPGGVVVAGTAPGRQVVERVVVELTSHGLCGLVGFARWGRARLHPHLHVGPRPQAPAADLPELRGPWGEGRAAPGAAGDAVRGVRPYVPGDPARHVHWPATARRGELVVKELEEPTAPTLTVVLDLGDGGPAGEAAAARAAWYLGQAGRRGYRGVLVAVEAGGARTGPVASVAAVNRRLARVVPGPAPAGPAGAPGTSVVFVGPDGDRWG